MQDKLKCLLDDLDKIAENHEEVGDTDVREQMSDAVLKLFIIPVEGYELPGEFGMFSNEGNTAVKNALEKFLQNVQGLIGSQGFDTPEHRLQAFQNEDIESDDGMYYDDYFGYIESI